MTDYIVEFENVSKYYKIKEKSRRFRSAIFPNYKEFLAVDNVNFKVKKNEIFGILGPNGAGKTTIIKMICGLTAPSSGRILINKKNIAKEYSKIQPMIGTMLGNWMIYNRMSGYANLRYYCKLYKIIDYKSRVNELLKLVDLYKWRNQLVETYSLGMKTKLALARALVHDPDVIILDEPTLGLDVRNSYFIREFLKKMNKTIIVTTHNMEVANDVCYRIILLNKGKIIKIDTPDKLKHEIFSNYIIEIETPDADDIIKLLEPFEFIEQLEKFDKNKLRIDFKYKENFDNIVKTISKKKILDFEKKIPSLEDVFLKITS
ncbi:MAG: ATP-binding cassette domain-containing protein [Candidatus Helarchaeota archaeon]